MNFQFYCPQGHLLQGDSAHAGTAIVCPICNVQFIIPPAPAPVVTPVVVPVQPAAQPPAQPTAEASTFDFAGSAPSRPRTSAKSGPGNLDTLLGGGASESAEAPDETQPEADAEPANPFLFAGLPGAPVDEDAVLDNDAIRIKSAQDLEILHIPCPKGHVLEVPRDMVGEKARCPYCKAIYTIEFERSLEYRKEQAEKEAFETARLGKIWLVRAGIAVILVVLFILFLLFS